MASAGERRRAVDRQRGAVAVLVAVLLVVLLAFAALVVDLGFVYRARSELQNAADSAALAAAQELDRTSDGLDRARLRAHEYAERNWAHRGPVELRDDDIIFGHWNDYTLTFTELGTDPSFAPAVNAIEIIDRREAGTRNPVSHFFAPIIGHPQTDTNALAIAIAGGPSSECGFPMVVPDCALDSAIEAGTCDYCMTFQDNNTDNAGWTSFEADSIGGPTIADLVYRACHDDSGAVNIDPTTGLCQGECNEVPAGMEVKVQNGNLMNQGGNNFCPVIQDLLLRGDPNNEPQPFTVKVPVLQSTDESCDAAQFSSYKEIAGFATLEIYGAKCAAPDPGVFVPAAPCTPPPSDKYIVAALRCDLGSTEPAGGGYFGLQSRHMRLVR